MRKNIFLTALSLCLAVACNQTPTTLVIGKVAKPQKDQQVILYSQLNDRALDSVKVVDGEFSFTIDATVAQPYYVETAHFFTDGDTVLVDIGTYQDLATGTPLTDIYTQINLRVDVLDREYFALMEQYREIPFEYRDSMDAKSYEIHRFLNDVYIPTVAQELSSAFDENFDNPLGLVLALRMVNFDTLPRIGILKKFTQQNPLYSQYTKAHGRIEQRFCFEKTLDGEMFSDFTVRNLQNTADVRLSDYVGRGKYVLVDFWSSSSRESVVESLNIKMLHTRYMYDNFMVLGVNILDESSVARQVVEQVGLPWVNLCDSSGEALFRYGANAMPLLVLFAPDGTILKRTMKGEQMVEVVDAIFAK
ncbi:MAG: TlpA disulfide reductase family protein [Rikenellaceae bacterium]